VIESGNTLQAVGKAKDLLQQIEQPANANG
jgi:hypothetical protein